MTASRPSKPRWVAYGAECQICEWSDRAHDCSPGVVRCAEGDIEAFQTGAAVVLDQWGQPEFPIKPPVWGWWRWNPDPARNYNQLLAEAKGPGRGNWRGALVIYKPERNQA